MVSIELPRNSAFLIEDFLYLVRKKFSFSLPGLIVTTYVFGAAKVQLKFFILADNSPPFLVSFIPSRHYLNKKQSSNENIHIHTKDYHKG